MKKIIKISKWAAISLLAAFVVLIIARIPFYIQNKNTEEQVAKIHATKLTMDDVMGVNLPPAPGADADKTVAGVDANNNGIRDDVELAIFKEYPNSAKTRAVLLQYALALQMEVTQPIVNSGTVGAVSGRGDSAFFCIASIVPGDDKQKNMSTILKYDNYILDRQLNTAERKKARDDFYQHLESGSIEDSGCDVDITTLSN